MSALEKAAAYYRKSTDQQEASIPRQREQVAAYAKRHGFTLIGEYVDEGIAGDEVERRPEFRRLLADAQRHKFTAILCDDVDRFGRFDSLTLGEVANPLRRAEVRLETAAQGLIDWNSFAGRLSNSILQEARKLESQALSRRLLTTLVMKAQQGERPNGYAPYGFKSEVGEDGKRRLALGDAHHVRVVQWMFKMVAEKHWTAGMIRDELARRGTSPPSGSGPGKKRPFKTKALGCWDRRTILNVLRNRAYVGDFVFGKTGQGKYSRQAGGNITFSDSRKRSATKNPEDQWIVRRDTHPAIVSRELFQRVQEVLTENRKRGGPRKEDRRRYLFNQLLVCKTCGAFMSPRFLHGRPVYICSTYRRFGAHACHRNTIHEAAILKAVVKAIKREYLNPERFGILKAEMIRQAEAERLPNGLATDLKRRDAELATMIDQGNTNLALLPGDVLPGVIEKLREWKGERERLRPQIAEIESGAKLHAVEEEVAAAEQALWALEESLGSASEATVAAALRDIVERIDLEFGEPDNPKQRRSTFRQGTINIRVPDAWGQLRYSES